MKRLLGSMVVLALAAPAVHAEPEAPTVKGDDTWRGVFAGGLMVTLAGVEMMWWGNQRIDTAEHALCTGTYRGTACGHPATLSVAEVEAYNAKGDRGQTVARTGAGVFLAGAIFTIYAGYRGFFKEHPQTERVSIVPTASPTGAGAQLTLRW